MSAIGPVKNCIISYSSFAMERVALKGRFARMVFLGSSGTGTGLPV